MFPLHIACVFNTADVVQYLLKLNDACLGHCDLKKNYPIHCACLRGNYGAARYLLLKGCVQSVSEKNDDNKLPIRLLWESGEKVNNKSPEYVETVWRGHTLRL